MTYCLGIMTHQGLVMASDSRANAGFDQVNVCPKCTPSFNQENVLLSFLPAGIFPLPNP